MARLNRFPGFRRHPWLIGLILATGCAQWRTNLQDTLARRVVPAEAAEGSSTSRVEGKENRSTTDDKVTPAAAAKAGQGPENSARADRASALPSAIQEAP